MRSSMRHGSGVASVDACGERGEIHTFVYAGPMFPHRIPIETGVIVERDGFVFADVQLVVSCKTPHVPQS